MNNKINKLLQIIGKIQPMADQIQNSKKIKHDDIHVVLEAELNKEEKGNKTN